MHKSTDSTTILIVEDSSIQALRLRRVLEQQNWKVAVAGNGREAMDYLREHEHDLPSLVISDIFMPEMNGYELCQTIKRDPKLQTLPVMLLTTVADVEDVFLILQAGADDYMSKPYGNEDLFAAVRALLSLPAVTPDLEAEPLLVTLTGRAYQVTAGRRQMLQLLLSSYRQCVAQSRSLISLQREVNEGRQQQQEHMRQIAALQEQLAEAQRRLQDGA